MKVEMVKNELVITVPLNKTPPLSASGKSRIVCTTHGSIPVGIEINGMPLKIGLNAFIAVPKNSKTEGKND